MTGDVEHLSFRPVAEHSLLVAFGGTAGGVPHDRVLQFDRALQDSGFPGFVESVPVEAAVLVRFDPMVCDHLQAERAARQLIGAAPDASRSEALHEVEVCYDGDLAPDLAAVAAATRLDPEQVVAAHLSGRYDVVMYGFAPGYAYLGGVPEPIRLPRKPAAVRGVAAGSVLVAGAQCLVSTLTMPTGWWVIGRSPTPILTGDATRPFRFEVGDGVRFRRIDRDRFDAAEAAG